MARFVSRFGKYRHGVRNAQTTTIGQDSQGNVIEQVRVSELIAVFGEDTLSEDEIQVGIKQLRHYGLPIDRDTEEHISPRSRISGFDSFAAQDRYGWSDEERVVVENALRESSHYGTDHLELLPTPAELPWPSYDSDSPSKIVDIARAIGSVEEAIAYESQNQNRLEVLQALAEEPVEEKDVVLDAS